MAMKQVICNQKPTGDIRQRQPKQPGLKPADWNKPARCIPDTPAVVWANGTKPDTHGNREWRCTKCGHTGHPGA